MSSNSTLESRRISDPRFKLKQIIDTQLKAQALSAQPDELSFKEQSVLSYSLQAFFDEGLDYVFNGDANAVFYTPFEPDFQYLTVHLYMENTGNQVRDYSGFKNHGNIAANPDLVDKINIGNGSGTIPSLNFDGLSDCIDLISNTSISTASYNTGLGFTIFCYIRPEDIKNDQDGYRRTISAKSDNADYGHMLCIDANGDLLFHVLENGTEYKVKASNAIHVTSVYQIAAVFDASTLTASLYVNNVKFTTASTTIIQPYPGVVPTTLLVGDRSLHIGRADGVNVPHGGGFDSQGFDHQGFDIANFDDILYPYVHGAFAGQILDYRLYMRPLTTSEINNLWQNKSTIFDVPLGAVGLAGFSVANG